MPHALLLLAACHPTPEVRVEVYAAVSGQALVCGEPLPVAGHHVTLRDLRLFVSDVVLIGEDGAGSSLHLSESRWQHDGVALLDFEDACHNGTSATNRSLAGRVDSEGPFRAVRFTVGVPEPLNHADPLTLEAPLTTAAMFWGWQAGHKFVRFDHAWDDQNIRVHLGSTGCRGAAGAVVGCEHPHRGELELPLADGVATLDLGPALVDHPGVGCMADPGDAACEPWFDLFGMTP